LTADVFLYTVPQFTVTAGLAATAAVLLWLSRGSARPWTPLTLVLFPALLALSAAWREHSCLMVLAVAAPLAAARIVWDWRTADCSARRRCCGWRPRPRPGR